MFNLESLLFSILSFLCSHLIATTKIVTITVSPTQLFVSLLTTSTALLEFHVQLVTRLLELQLPVVCSNKISQTNVLEMEGVCSRLLYTILLELQLIVVCSNKISQTNFLEMEGVCSRLLIATAC